MAKKYCSVDDFIAELEQQFSYYTDEVTKRVKAGTDKVIVEVKEEIEQQDVPIRTGRYRKAFRIKKAVYEDRYNKRNTWYVAAPYYRLTHLLENGHLVRNGTKRVPAHPHIIYGERIAERRMVEIVKEAVKP